MRGYFWIGIYHTKTSANVGTLWRSAYQLGASGIFTVGARYPRQASDTTKTWRHVPLMEFDTFDDLYNALPYACRLIGVEMGGRSLSNFSHPQQVAYLLGAEDSGLPPDIIKRCHGIVSIPAIRIESYNVAVAGSIVMYDRFVKTTESENDNER